MCHLLHVSHALLEGMTFGILVFTLLVGGGGAKKRDCRSDREKSRNLLLSSHLLLFSPLLEYLS